MKKLRNFQVWYNAETDTIYESRLCRGYFIMYKPTRGSLYVIQKQIENSVSWFYIGNLYF